MTPDTDLSLATLAGLYSSGRSIPEEVVGHVYERIEEHRSQPVWIHLVPREEALMRARELQSKHPGPLYGIPFAIKDNIDVAGLPTTAGCPAFSHVAEHTSFVVQRLLNAGAILIGKTNMDQFATGLVGTRSPFGACSSVFDSLYVSGGSSSGSAVAVASGLVSFSLGTDTAGSGRVPAAFNNIVGLKPARGLLSMTGVIPACRSLDCVSIFALGAFDAARVLTSAAALDDADAYSRKRPETILSTPGKFRCGVPPDSQLEFFGDQLAQRVYRDTVSALKELQAEIVEIDFAPFRAAAELLYAGPYVAERFVAVGPFIKAHPDSVDPTVRSIILGSERYTAAEAYAAEYRLQALRNETKKSWDRMDALLLPTAPTIYKIDEVKRDPVKLNSNLGYYTNFVNLLDLSAVAVPAGIREDGLPFGVTLVGPAFSEHSLLQWAGQIQSRRNEFAGARVAKLSALPEYKAPDHLKGWTKLAVVGAHLSGQPLNHQLTDRGSTLMETTLTAPDYKLYALTNTAPAKPGLVRVPGFKGSGVEVEVWRMPEYEFGSFVAAVSPPLSIGSCQLKSGEWVKGFVCEPYGIDGMPEITSFGGWRNYLRSK